MYADREGMGWGAHALTGLHTRLDVPIEESIDKQPSAYYIDKVTNSISTSQYMSKQKNVTQSA